MNSEAQYIFAGSVAPDGDRIRSVIGVEGLEPPILSL